MHTVFQQQLFIILHTAAYTVMTGMHLLEHVINVLACVQQIGTIDILSQNA